MESTPREVILVMCTYMELHSIASLLSTCKRLAPLLEHDDIYMKAVTRRRFSKHRSWKQTAKRILLSSRTISIAVCGQARSGKSSIIRGYTKSHWYKEYKPSKDVHSTLHKDLGDILLELTEYPQGMQPQRDHDIMWYIWAGFNDNYKLEGTIPVILFYNTELLGIRSRAQMNALRTKLWSMPVAERHEVHAQSLYNQDKLMDSTKRALRI